MSYDDLFVLYENSRSQPKNEAAFHALVMALSRYVRLWARDVLRSTDRRYWASWQDDVFQTGFASLCVRLKELYERAEPIEDGRNLVNSLRKGIRPEMKAEFQKRFVLPVPPPDTVRKRIRRGKPAYRPWELKKQVDLRIEMRQGRIKRTNRPTYVDPSLFAKEYSGYWEFLDHASQSARTIATESGWVFVQFMLDEGANQTEAAKTLGIPRSTLGDRLRRLRYKIVGAASRDLEELGSELLGRRWESAAA